jgi:multidrug resistance efflux pump
MLDSKDIEAAVDELERNLEDYTAGWRNDEALRSTSMLISRIKTKASWNLYISEKLCSLSGWLAALYSERKWRRYGSLEQVKNFAFQECEKIRMYLPQLEQIAANARESQAW